MGRAGNQKPRGGRHVAVQGPGGPRDLSRALERHRQSSDAQLTTPATTPVPTQRPRMMSRDNGEVLSSPVTGSAWSAGNTWHPRVPGEYAGY